jgi:hypothetical protein
MALEEVTAKVTAGDRADEVFAVKYDLPATIEEAKQKYGEEVVYSRFRQSLVIDLQSFMRTHIKKDGATPGTVQEAVDQWAPGVRQAAKPLTERIADLMKRMTPDERREFLEEYL